MKALKYVTVALALCLPMLMSGVQAQAATADQYAARGHGRHPMMSNRPSRTIYHRHHYHMRRHHH